MVGVVLMIVATFVLVLIMGGQLSTKSDMIEMLNKELRESKMRDNSGPLNLETMYRVLQEEGYFPTKDSNGEVSFKIKGTRVDVGECASGFVYTRVCYNLEKEYLEAGVYAANEVNQTFVAIKTLISQQTGALVFSVESYCKDVEVYREFLQRSLAIIVDSDERFREEINKFTERETKQLQLIDEQPTRSMDPKMLS